MASEVLETYIVKKYEQLERELEASKHIIKQKDDEIDNYKEIINLIKMNFKIVEHKNKTSITCVINKDNQNDNKLLELLTTIIE